MTSKLTRDRLQEIAEDGFLKHGESKELARMALAAMDSEPVAWGNGCDKTVPAALRYLAENERPFGGESRFNAAHLYQLAREIELMAEAPLYRHAQPAPVVPDAATAIRACLSEFPESARNIVEECADIAENAWRAAMLQELQKSAGAEATCRSNENVQVLHTKSPAQSDCCPAQNSVTPAQGGNSLVIPDEMTSGQAYEIGYYYGDPVDVFARGANWMRQHIIDSTLAAAPQSPGSEPATVPGKWIPVSERMPEVGDIVLTAMGGVVNVGEMECSAANCRFFTSVISGRELPATHWLPLPAGPKEDINALIPLVSRNEQEGK